MRCDTSYRSEERYRVLVEQSSEGMYRVEMDAPIPLDLPEDEQIQLILNRAYIAECNDAMARMYGFSSAGELVGRRLASMLDGSDPYTIEYLRQCVQARYHLTDIESHELDRDGRTRYFLNNFIGVIENNAVVRVWGAQRDITERKQNEQERTDLLHREQRARAEAERANRRKDQFLAVLSHELRTPLTPVLARLALIKRDPGLSAEVRSSLEMIRRNVELEARLIEDLLDLTKIATGKIKLNREVIDVHQVVQDALEIYRGEMEVRQLAVSLDLKASRFHAVADPARMEQVFWNLISNAVKYTPVGGTIAISSENEGDTLRIRVTDSGIGIEPSVMSRIFNAFEQGEETLNRRYGGLGLGLSISRSLLEMHGGKLYAVSAGKDQGSTFTVEIKSAAAPVAPTTEAPQAPQRSLRILLVEDNEDTARVLARFLRLSGHQVRTADTVRSALDAAMAEPYDVLVSDIGLPDGSGWDLMKQIQALRPVRGIALSGFALDEDIQRSRDAGFVDHLAKPVMPERLQAAILEVAR